MLLNDDGTVQNSHNGTQTVSYTNASITIPALTYRFNQNCVNFEKAISYDPSWTSGYINNVLPYAQNMHALVSQYKGLDTSGESSTGAAITETQMQTALIKTAAIFTAILIGAALAYQFRFKG